MTDNYSMTFGLPMTNISQHNYINRTLKAFPNIRHEIFITLKKREMYFKSTSIYLNKCRLFHFQFQKSVFIYQTI